MILSTLMQPPERWPPKRTAPGRAEKRASMRLQAVLAQGAAGQILSWGSDRYCVTASSACILRALSTGELSMGGAEAKANHRIYTMSFASVYPLYVAKAERKGRTKAEVDQIISWLTGYDQKGLQSHLK